MARRGRYRKTQIALRYRHSGCGASTSAGAPVAQSGSGGVSRCSRACAMPGAWSDRATRYCRPSQPIRSSYISRRAIASDTSLARDRIPSPAHSQTSSTGSVSGDGGGGGGGPIRSSAAPAAHAVPGAWLPPRPAGAILAGGGTIFCYGARK
jgi:hypothetical protein